MQIYSAFKISKSTAKYSILILITIESDAVDTNINATTFVTSTFLLGFFVPKTFSLGNNEIFVGLGTPRVERFIRIVS